MNLNTTNSLGRNNQRNYFLEILLKGVDDMFMFVFKDAWGKRRGAFLPSRSFNQLWKERQQK